MGHQMGTHKYELVKNIATLSDKNGMTKELNLIKFNDANPVYDLRKWNRIKDRMLKGISFSKEEMMDLRDVLNGMEL